MSRHKDITCDYAGHEIDYWVDFWWVYLIRLGQQRDARLYAKNGPFITHAAQGWTLNHEGMTEEDLQHVAFALQALANAVVISRRVHQ
jgi:hypothetical protein